MLRKVASLIHTIPICISVLLWVSDQNHWVTPSVYVYVVSVCYDATDAAAIQQQYKSYIEYGDEN